MTSYETIRILSTNQILKKNKIGLSAHVPIFFAKRNRSKQKATSEFNANNELLCVTTM